MDILSDKIVKIRKSHTCFCCGRKFEVDTRMNKGTFVDGRIYTLYTCLACNEIMTSFPDKIVAKIVGINISAKEITSMVFEFIEWAVRKEMLQYSGSAEEWQTTYCGNYLNLEELFQYWWDNVKNK